MHSGEEDLEESLQEMIHAECTLDPMPVSKEDKPAAAVDTAADDDTQAKQSDDVNMDAEPSAHQDRI